jgi:hypothetical protein
MLDLAVKLGFGAKFTGSGGAAVLVKDVRKRELGVQDEKGEHEKEDEEEDDAKVEEVKERAGDSQPPQLRKKQKTGGSGSGSDCAGGGGGDSGIASDDGGSGNGGGRDGAAVVVGKGPLSSSGTFLLSEGEENAAKARFEAEGFAFARVVVAPSAAGW